MNCEKMMDSYLVEKCQKLWQNDADGLHGLFSLGYSLSQKDRTSFVGHCVLWEFCCSIGGRLQGFFLWFEVNV